MMRGVLKTLRRMNLGGCLCLLAGALHLLWRRTVVSQEWLAARLVMRSAANVSRQLRRLDRKGALKKVPAELKQFLDEADTAKS